MCKKLTDWNNKIIPHIHEPKKIIIYLKPWEEIIKGDYEFLKEIFHGKNFTFQKIG